ncbi:efflux RND transporter periplasmic adaptor subunit [Rhodopirellula sp. MGV]|uniref:efflux RND transporter periplasmic adaptor subunit n=1 Tax=Rhodopirellula sp. MGV TaxID=2023130 RepID=UPI000B968657|nr:efflux RND transporter periplasmic adaptor subunit [Rhodopirellula sp. MGV]OYP31162.1 hypothetical protein CGZ80_21475 [Rhodopirellula sp. MGV]PNY36015.1 efflux RND transporter periplasmic adaptor subunit [Rhodopirellula baltica]
MITSLEPTKKSTCDRRFGRRMLRCVLLGALVTQSGPSGFAQDGTINPTSQGSQSYRSPSLSLDYEGFTEPRYDILLAATEIGRLDSVDVEVGDVIEEGQVVAKLEDGLQAEAVATADWRSKMRGETDAAEADVKLKELRLQQLRSLEEQSMARPDELKRAMADWEIAKARQLAAQEQDQLRQLELRRYQLQLERRKIKAPMRGVVAEVFHAPGEYITPADPAVIRLVVNEQLYGVFNIPVEEISMIRQGDIVSVHVMSVSTSINATVESIAPDIDGESGTIEVRVLIDNRDGKLRSGDRCQMKPMRRSAGSFPTRLPIAFGRSQSKTPNAARQGENRIR